MYYSFHSDTHSINVKTDKVSASKSALYCKPELSFNLSQPFLLLMSQLLIPTFTIYAMDSLASGKECILIRVHSHPFAAKNISDFCII